MTIESELLEDWYRRYRHRDPMHPKDPEDRCLGWIYAICSHWRQSVRERSQLRQGKQPRDEIYVITYESTLGDARATLEIEATAAEVKHCEYYRRMSMNRFYASNGESMHTLVIVPVCDNDPENIC